MRTVLLVGLVAFGCKSSEPSATSGSGTRQTATPSDAAQLGIRTVLEYSHPEFSRGVAVMRKSGLEVVLEDPPASCADGRIHSRGHYLTFEIPRGPGGAYATGREVNVWVQVGGNGERYYGGLEPRNTVARFEPFEAHMGSRIRGTLELHRTVVKTTGFDATEKTETLRYEASGTFEVEICEEPPNRAALVEDPKALAGKLGGTWDGKRLELSDGIAEIGNDVDDHHISVTSISFADGEPYDCESARKKPPRTMLDLSSMGGGSKSRPLPGAQRVSVSLDRKQGHSYLFDQEGETSWVSFEHLAWSQNGEIRGVLFAVSAPGVPEPFRIMGTFKARVCEVSEHP